MLTSRYLQATQEVLKQYAGAILPPSHPTTRMVQKVADRLIRSNGLGPGATAQNPTQVARQDESQPVQWKVRVIDDKSTKNA